MENFRFAVNGAASGTWATGLLRSTWYPNRFSTKRTARKATARRSFWICPNAMKLSTESDSVIPSPRSKPHISILLATWFGLGYLPKAPGTWGSAAAVGLATLSSWCLDRYVDHVTGVLDPSHFFATSYYTLNIQVFTA